jgi:hypothetical protein
MGTKVILITGASKRDGVGYHLCKELLAHGHRIIATSRTPEQSDLINDKLATESELSIRSLDLCSKESIKTFTQGVLDDYGSIDVLVNNAAQVVVGPTEAAGEEDITTTFQSKVFGPLALIRAFLPGMREQNSGIITTTGSIFCAMPFIMPGISVYLASVNALERIHESMSIELGPWNIKVFNFHAGPIKTSLTIIPPENQILSDRYYKNFTEHAYTWFGEYAEWQTAEDVAIPYAKAILNKNPDFHVYSSKAGARFAEKYTKDVSANSYRKELREHFEQLSYDPGDWELKRDP